MAKNNNSCTRSMAFILHHSEIAMFEEKRKKGKREKEE
jgi:hypothetical protein